jgi:hypothetical protein
MEVVPGNGLTRLFTFELGSDSKFATNARVVEVHDAAQVRAREGIRLENACDQVVPTKVLLVTV